MPTHARCHQLQKSLLLHVFSRGHNRQIVFKEREDYDHFLKLIERYKARYGLVIYHWVLMPNHFHLLMEIADPRLLPKIMAGMLRSYTTYHHQKYSACGYLWQGRYKSQPIEKENYLLACGRYIERNPVRAGGTEAAWMYPYSSAQQNALGIKDGITSPNPCMENFGATEERRRLGWQDFLRKFSYEEEREFDSIEKPVGSEIFRQKIFKEGYRYQPRRQGRRQNI